MGLLDYFLNEKKQKKENMPILDTTYVDPNDGDSIVINGNAQLNIYNMSVDKLNLRE